MNDRYLDDLEDKIYHSTFCDGLLDIYSGLMFVAVGIVPLFESIGISRFIVIVFLVPPLIALVPLGRRIVSTPRLGVVHLGERRKELKKRMRYMSWLIVWGIGDWLNG